MLWDSILRGLKTDASMGLVDQQELGPWDMWASTQLCNCESQGVNSGARASTMRGRVGVIFQGRGFESHRRRVLQFYFQRKRGRTGSKIFAVANTKAALV